MQMSVVKYKEINEAKRIDAEFYSPSNQLLLKVLTNKPVIYSLKDITRTITDMGAFSLYRKEYFVEEGIPFLRVDNIKENRLDFTDTIYISQKYHEQLKKSQVKPRDVLLTTKAIIGYACTVPDTIKLCNMSQNLVRMVIKENLCNPYYLSTFLTSKYGLFQTNRLATGNVQLYLNFENISKVLVPIFSSSFQSNIETVVCESEKFVELSKQVYSQAEQVLLEELGIAKWKPNHKLSFVKKYSDTKESERIDAEYFQTKYEEIIKTVKKYSGGWDILGSLVKMKKSIEPGSNEYQEDGIKFLRVSNLSKFGLDGGNPVYLSEKFHNENKQHQPKQGEILLSKDATPGIAYYLNGKPEMMIVSGGILRLKLEDERVNEDYLTLVLNSVLVQEQAERDSGGSVIKHWRPDQIKKIVIPVLENAKQNQIQKKIRQSFEARTKSKHLLECAKQAVEIAIERDEKTAMQWLKKQTEKL